MADRGVRDLTGQRLGHFRVDGVIGRGGMSVLYRATDTRLGRRVALKVIDESLAADREFRERFVDEARNTSAVDHAHVVPLYDFDETDGHLYIAMRHVEGPDLASVIDRRPVPVARTLRLLGQVADALDAVHARGLVHLDVKPANVLVTTRESAGEHVYLADFGLTRRGATGHRTSGGDFLGSPTYAAPEHLRGEPVDARTDVYSLTCVLFTCLTGRAPYLGSVTEVIDGHLAGEVPSIAELVGVDPRVDDVVRRGMDPDRPRRHESASAVVEAARGALTGPGPAPLVGPPSRRPAEPPRRSAGPPRGHAEPPRRPGRVPPVAPVAPAAPVPPAGPVAPTGSVAPAGSVASALGSAATDDPVAGTGGAGTNGAGTGGAGTGGAATGGAGTGGAGTGGTNDAGGAVPGTADRGTAGGGRAGAAGAGMPRGGTAGGETAGAAGAGTAGAGTAGAGTAHTGAASAGTVDAGLAGAGTAGAGSAGASTAGAITGAATGTSAGPSTGTSPTASPSHDGRRPPQVPSTLAPGRPGAPPTSPPTSTPFAPPTPPRGGPPAPPRRPPGPASGHPASGHPGSGPFPAPGPPGSPPPGPLTRSSVAPPMRLRDPLPPDRDGSFVRSGGNRPTPLVPLVGGVVLLAVIVLLVLLLL